LFPQINNIYRISYDEQFRPLALNRSVSQKELLEEINTNYDHNTQKAIMSRSSTHNSSTYTISKNSRDPFSLLAYIGTGKAAEGVYNIDGNGLPWQAKVRSFETEIVKTSLGKYLAKRYDLTFTNLTGKKMPYTDMVTFNMLSENNKMSLWVSEENVILKALVKKGAISVTWEIIGISQ